MPLYEYECDACGGRFEVIQKFSEPSTECRRCGKGPVRRLMAAPAIQFKGTGFYITDYARKDQGKGDQDKAEKSDKATESKPTASESKPASTSESATPAPNITPKAEG